MTIAEDLVRVLLENGYEEKEHRSKKYRKFSKKGSELAFFVGKRGALRFGKVATNSKPINRDVFFKRMEKK